MTDVESYLVKRGFTVKQATNNNVHIACPFCAEDPSKRGRLYISTEPPGPFMCHLCGQRGTLRNIQRLYGDEPDDAEWENPYTIQAIWTDAAEYYHQHLDTDTIQWLKNERGLTLDTIQKHQLGWAGTYTSHHLFDYLVQEKQHSVADVEKTGLVKAGRDFLTGKVTIPYHVNGNVKQIRGKDIQGKYMTPPGARAQLFNVDVSWTAEEILITEGEFDALVLEQMGYAAVGVPGAMAWQTSWNGYFSEAKRNFIVFDHDDTGRDGAEKVAHALGPRSLIVKWPEDFVDKGDVTDFIVKQGQQKEDFERLLNRSKGGSLLTVWDAYEEWKETQNVPALKLGFDRIDLAISPGILPWQVLVVLAKTNVGKTIFTLNLFQRMCMANPDLKILFVSLEQTRGEWFERARRIFKFYNLDADDHDCLEYFSDKLMIVDKNRVAEHELITNIEQFEQEMGAKPDIVAVDYLGYWARSYKGEGYERTTSAIMAMKSLAKENRIAFITPHQVNRQTQFGEEPEVDSGKESGAVEETADYVFQLWSPDQRKGKTVEDKTGEINLMVGKSRHGGVRTQEKLIYAQKSLVMVPQDDPLIRQAKNELMFPHMSYDDMMELHKNGGRPVPIHRSTHG